jgi:hypothetical protein
VEKIWITREGKCLKVSEMHTLHIQNAIKLLHETIQSRDYSAISINLDGELSDYYETLDWIEIFGDELERRKKEEEEWVGSLRKVLQSTKT